MIGCPVDGCPDLFVHATLLGRHLRRRHFGTEPDPVEEPCTTNDVGGCDAGGTGEADGGF